VLLLLAAECNRPVHRDRLIGALWPDEGTGASRALQVAVSSLRKFVAEAADRHDHAASPSVVHRGEGYMLDLGGGLSDTEAFDGALVRARAAQDDGTRATVSALGEAIALYRGDLFAHEGGSEWLVESREVFRRRAAEAAEQLASERLQEGDWPAAQRAARRGLEIDRYQDALWRTLIRAQQGCGDRAAAARSSREYQQVLVELGVPPTAT